MATAPTTKPTVPTVPLSKVAAELAEKTGMTKKDATGALDDFVGLIVKHLKKGNKVRITGLGILQVRNRPARMGRNPATGEASCARIFRIMKLVTSPRRSRGPYYAGSIAGKKKGGSASRYPPDLSPSETGQIASLRSLATRKATFFDALILIASPVAGLRPMRAGRLRT